MVKSTCLIGDVFMPFRIFMYPQNSILGVGYSNIYCVWMLFSQI